MCNDPQMILADLLPIQHRGGGEDASGGVEVEVKAGHAHLYGHCDATVLILIRVHYLDLQEEIFILL